MPVVKVWGLPQVLGKPKFSRVIAEYRDDIMGAVLSVGELKLYDRTQVTVIFPAELALNKGGLQLVVEINGLEKEIERTQAVRDKLAKSVGETVEKEIERTQAVRDKLAKSIGRTVQAWYPKAFVECFVGSVGSSDGFWRSSG
jgi:hypothetical protein